MMITMTLASSSLSFRRLLLLLRRVRSSKPAAKLPSKPLPPAQAGLSLSGSMDLPDDIFGPSLNLEETHLKEGFQEGYNAGSSSGKEDGREVGLKTGFITSEDLGFYRGCIDVWKSAIQVEPTCFSTRVQKNIKEMDELVSKYPLLEPENESVTDIMASLRLKFRAICATLNVKLEYNGYPKAETRMRFSFKVKLHWIYKL